MTATQSMNTQHQRLQTLLSKGAGHQANALVARLRNDPHACGRLVQAVSVCTLVVAREPRAVLFGAVHVLDHGLDHATNGSDRHRHGVVTDHITRHPHNPCDLVVQHVVKVHLVADIRAVVVDRVDVVQALTPEGGLNLLNLDCFVSRAPAIELEKLLIWRPASKRPFFDLFVFQYGIAHHADLAGLGHAVTIEVHEGVRLSIPDFALRRIASAVEVGTHLTIALTGHRLRFGVRVAV